MLDSDDAGADDESQPTPPLKIALENRLRVWRGDVAELAAEFLLRREVRTDANGQFEITNLYDVPYNLEAFLDGWTIETEASDLHPGATVAFEATRLISLTVSVTRTNGGSVASAFVYSEEERYDPLEFEYSSIRLRWTPSNRTIRVPAEMRSFRARIGTVVSALVRVQATDGGHVELSVGPSARLRAHVIWPESGPDSGSVSLRAYVAGGDPASAVTGNQDGDAVDFGTVTVGQWRIEATSPAGRVMANTFSTTVYSS